MRNAPKLQILGSISSILGLSLTLVLFLAGDPIAAAILGATVVLAWGVWVTISIQKLKTALRGDAVHQASSVPAPRYQYAPDWAVRIDANSKKFRIPSNILAWDAATLLFWVNLDREICNSSGNRYLFSYTTNARDDSGYPNGFYFYHPGGTTHWTFRFHREPSQKNANYIQFDNAPNTTGVCLIAIRWCEQLDSATWQSSMKGCLFKNEPFCPTGTPGHKRASTKSISAVGGIVGQGDCHEQYSPVSASSTSCCPRVKSSRFTTLSGARVLLS